MAHCTSGPPTARIFTDGTICPDWYNIDHAFQSVQGGVYTTHESPTIAGTSVQESTGSPLELSNLVSATRRASRNKALDMDSKPNPPATKESRQRRTKVCARCKKSKIKCILGDGNSCLRCDCMGVPCVLPPARRPREKELRRRAGKAPREKCVFANMRGTHLLTYDQDHHSPPTRGFKLERRAV